MESVFDQLAGDFPAEADERLSAAFELSHSRFKAAVRELRNSQAVLPPGAAELASLGLGPLRLGNVRPPDVVTHIFRQLPDGDRYWIDDFLRPLEGDDDVRARIQTLCSLLVLAGFCRDKKLGKNDTNTSSSGAQAALRDIYHIAAAASLDLFVTSDKGAAKLAFSVYEHFKLKTIVLHLRVSEDRPSFRAVGLDYWP